MDCRKIKSGMPTPVGLSLIILEEVSKLILQRGLEGLVLWKSVSVYKHLHSQEI